MTNWHESKAVPKCGPLCEHVHGDQAPTEDELKIAELEAEVMNLRRAAHAGEMGVRLEEREQCARIAELPDHRSTVIARRIRSRGGQ